MSVCAHLHDRACVHSAALDGLLQCPEHFVLCANMPEPSRLGTCVCVCVCVCACVCVCVCVCVCTQPHRL